MRYTDAFIITEAQRRAEAFEGEVQRAQLLAQRPRSKSWRYYLAQWLLQSAVRLEPKLDVRTTTTRSAL